MHFILSPRVPVSRKQCLPTRNLPDDCCTSLGMQYSHVSCRFVTLRLTIMCTRDKLSQYISRCHGHVEISHLPSSTCPMVRKRHFARLRCTCLETFRFLPEQRNIVPGLHGLVHFACCEKRALSITVGFWTAIAKLAK